ncbi:MAG: DUF4390 domain-containing protein [Mariprofundus sp.]
MSSCEQFLIELILFCCYTPAVMICRIYSNAMACLLLLAGLSLFAHPIMAVAGDDRLQVLVDGPVIHCDAELQTQRKVALVALQDGIETTVLWHIQVAEVRQYWLNRAIADISVSRRVTPDLLSRSWLLQDEASGISRRVYAIDAAMRFLFHLEQFPVLDRSLLTQTIMYRIQVKAELHQGEIEQTWWTAVWHPAQIVMEKDFQLQ